VAKKTPKPSKKASEDVVATARKRFEAALAAETDNRKSYADDVNFSCTDDQWPDEVKRLRGQDRPMLTINRLNGVIKQIVGDYRQNKIAIKVLPASGEASEEVADILAGLVRNIEQQSNADVARTSALDCAARGGFGYYRVMTEYEGEDSFDQNIVVRPIHNPLTVYFDPSARLITREDARWCFVTEMVKREDFEAMYPDAEPQDFNSGDAETNNWNTADEVRVAEYFEKVKYTARLGAFSNGMVMEITDDKEIAALASIGVTLVKERQAEKTKIVWRKMTSSEVLETREYLMPYIPIIPVLGEEVDVQGKVVLRSAIYYAKDAQRAFNYWRTAATESVALASKAPWLLTPEEIEGFQEQWARVNTQPMPYLLYNRGDGGGMPQRNDPPTVPIGELALANNASDDIKATTSMYDASLGARGNETSGRAILARQQEGDTATYLFVDNLKKAVEYEGKVILAFIRLVYDAERVVRVLDLEGKPSTKVVNQRVYDPMTGVTQVLNSLTVGKYDVIVSTGPNFASQKIEMINALQQVLPNLPIVGQVAPDLIVRALPFQGMDKVAERIERALPPNITGEADSPEAQAAQAQQMQMQQQMAEGQMKVQQAKSEAEVMKAQATMVKAQADVAKATQPQVVTIQ
jgi:hypothetical protein